MFNCIVPSLFGLWRSFPRKTTDIPIQVGLSLFQPPVIKSPSIPFNEDRRRRGKEVLIEWSDGNISPETVMPSSPPSKHTCSAVWLGKPENRRGELKGLKGDQVFTTSEKTDQKETKNIPDKNSWSFCFSYPRQTMRDSMDNLTHPDRSSAALSPVALFVAMVNSLLNWNPVPRAADKGRRIYQFQRISIQRLNPNHILFRAASGLVQTDHSEIQRPIIREATGAPLLSLCLFWSCF